MNSNETVFRFMSIRTGVKSKEKEKLCVKCWKGEGQQTATHKLLATAKANDDLDEMKKICKEFRKKPEYIDNTSKLKVNMQFVDEWAQNNYDLKIDDQKFKGEMQKLLGDSVVNIINSPGFKSDLENLTDTIITATIIKGENSPHINSLMRILKICHTLELFDAGDIKFDNKTIIAFLRKMQLILPSDVFPIPREKKQEPHIGVRNGGGKKEVIDKNKILGELADLQSAYKEVALVKTSVLISDVNRKKIDDVLPTVKAPSGFWFFSPRSEGSVIDKAMDKIETKVNLNTLTIPKEVSQYFTSSTKDVLKKLNINADAVNPKHSLYAIKTATTDLIVALLRDTNKEKVLRLGGLVIAYDKIKDALRNRVHIAVGNTDVSYAVSDVLASYVAGVGDLLLVKQQLKAYELSDFAHVENVLAGESKERTHRRKNVTEEEELIREETEETTEKDLQSTDRHEMQNEAERIVKNDLKAEAGLQVSGSYGPTVSFSANASVGFNMSSEESKRKSSTFAKEVTERTVESIKKKVIEERVKRVREEIEEINVHGINNEDGDEHIVGVYRWLNKVYDAQIFNYGKRMMLEFVIPEPSANYLYAILESPPEGSIILKPEEPMNIEGTELLRPKHIDDLNYEYWVSKYEVTSASVPPERLRSIVFQASKMTSKKQDAHSGFVEIPEGYQATDVVAHTLVFMQGGDRENWWFVFAVGDICFTYTDWVQSKSFSRPFTKQIAMSIRASDKVAGYAVAAHIMCEPTDEKWEQWRQDMYDAIMEAYWRQKSDYEEAMAAAAISEGIQIVGRNPLENRRNEQNELKRLAISLLTRQEFDEFNSLTIGDDGWPRLNFEEIDNEGPYIRFFENAFEWNHIIYVFYPYFWGQRNNWSKYLHFQDPDPDFAAFLKAGAVRVQVPVRPGFENAVTYFIQNQKIWEGDEVPIIGDDLYVSVTQEVAESLNAPDNMEPYSDPWEVAVPTSLVVLQRLDQIPGIRDVLTGNIINIGDGNGGNDE